MYTSVLFRHIEIRCKICTQKERWSRLKTTDLYEGMEKIWFYLFFHSAQNQFFLGFIYLSAQLSR
jgi:hypothetical protein